MLRPCCRSAWQCRLGVCWGEQRKCADEADCVQIGRLLVCAGKQGEKRGTIIILDKYMKEETTLEGSSQES